MTTTTTTDTRRLAWRARVVPWLSYAIALGLLLAAPTLAAATTVLALVTHDTAVAGCGLVGGAVLGAAGALGLMWCLARPRNR